MGKCYVHLGDDERVQAMIDSLVADHNDLPRVAHQISYIGDHYYYTKQYQKAIDLWEGVCARYREKRRPSLLQFLLGTCYEELKDYPKAIEHYERVVEKFPNCKYGHRAPYRLGLLCRRTGQYEKAAEWQRRQREMYPGVEPYIEWSLMSEGAVYFYELKDYGRAIPLYRRYVTEYPRGYRVATAYRWMAQCHDKLGERAQAVAVLNEALAKCRDPEDAEGIRKELAELAEGGEK